MSRYSIEDSTIVGIADAVRNMRHEKDLMTTDEIIEKINATQLGIPIKITNRINSETGKWERPSDWPDLDELVKESYDGEHDVLYLTYDFSGTKYSTSKTVSLYFEVVDEKDLFLNLYNFKDGELIPIRSSLKCSSGYVISLNPSLVESPIVVVQIEGSKDIFVKKIKFDASGSSNGNLQPCVERAGFLPYCEECDGTVWLERDSLFPGKNVQIKSLASRWNQCFSLQSLDLSSWNTDNWAVTSLVSCWNQCCSLQSLDLSSWNTDNWAVTSLASCWNQCRSLQSLDLSSWNTDNWAVTSLSDCWDQCCSLQSLDLSSWNTDNWAVRSIGFCWNQCFSLQSLDLSSWNTDNWAVTSLASCWNQCCSLQSLDLSSWNTDNWAVTSLASCWNQCYSLRSLDLSSWNTDNWAVTSLVTCWYQCFSLQSLDLSSWNTDNWAVTSFANCWYRCCSLQSLDLSSWNTDNWAVTSFANCWYQCYSLYVLKGCEKWNFVSKLTGSNVDFPNLVSLEDFKGIPISINHSYSDAVFLTKESLIAILNALPTVTSSQTITLGKPNKSKLSEDEIKIATNKGWSVV